ncbi:Ribosome-releasing factor 2, mitochondrial [Varicellaria rhodocarpa]|nr:Ribosome-releasing factor 2, mitochondrial [Varicellaria rhodocarpa]
MRLISSTDVDDGSTVTDFLPAERARGITIQSAAVTFHWPPLVGYEKDSKSNIRVQELGFTSKASHTINLIDTPGHADFTFEVLRSLRILDGAVCILDGVAGVEAQTEKVWYQAERYQIPKIIYINKLDRDGAAFGRTVKEIATKLHVWPALCQIPWFEDDNGKFIGVVDIVNLKAIRWAKSGDGKEVKILGLAELNISHPKLVSEAQKARIALIELLSEQDDLMVENYLECDESHMEISPTDITDCLKRCLLAANNRIVPVLAGASFRNIGVQPVLDAIIDLLPDPDQSLDPEVSLGDITGGLRSLTSGKLLIAERNDTSQHRKKIPLSQKRSVAKVQHLEACALAFKVVNDPRRGILVYIRVYHGTINRNIVLYNTNLQVTERAPRLLKMYASDATEVDSIPAGQIGVIPGLKYARTGDTLISYIGVNPKTGPPFPFNTLQLRPIDVPPPLFSTSLEPKSLSEQQALPSLLSLLIREDPSLQASVNDESGQTVLSGMGELHLEIAGDRLINDFKAKVTMGKIEIGYRETIISSAGPESVIFERETSGKGGKAGCTAVVSRSREDSSEQIILSDFSTRNDGNLVTISFTNVNLEANPESLSSHFSLELIQAALANGALAALARGPVHHYVLHSTHVHLTLDASTHIFGADTTPTVLSTAARLATQAALRKSAGIGGTKLMEPVMNVIINVDEPSLGAVVHDLSSSRGGHIISLDDADITSSINPVQSREDLPPIDLRRVYAPPDPFAVSSVAAGDEHGVASDKSRQRTITAKVPLREMIGYLKYLRSLTAGRGTFVMSVDRFETMSEQREKMVLKETSGI